MVFNFTADCYPSENKFVWLSFLLNGLITTMCVLVGLVGICFCWWRQRIEHKRKDMFMSTLCCWDALLLTSTMGTHGVVVLFNGHSLWKGPSVYFFVVFYPLCQTALAGSAWTLVLISHQRFRALHDPLRRLTDQGNSQRRQCMAILVVAILLNAPSAFSITTDSCRTENSSWTVQLVPTAIGVSATYRWMYHVLIHTFCMSVLPLLIVGIFTVRILMIRREAVRRWENNSFGSGWSQKKVRRTLLTTPQMLCGMLSKFFICYSVPCVVNLLTILSLLEASNQVYQLLTDIGNLLIVINSSSNWCMMMSTNSKSINTRRRGTSLNRTERILLADIWDHADTEQMFLDLFATMATKYPPDSDTTRGQYLTVRQRRQQTTVPRDIDSHAHIVRQSLTKLVHDLRTRPESVDIREQLRSVGCVHHDQGVHLHNDDWFLVRRTFIEKLAPNGVRLMAEQTAVSKFVSLLVREIKLGYMCQTSGESKSSSSLSSFPSRDSFSSY